MANQIVNYQCPACCATLRYDGALGKLKCDYCDGVYEVAWMEAQYKEQEERAAKAKEEEAASSWGTDGMTQDWGSEAEGMKSYICPSCGAELICDANTAATCCPYCGNQTVIPGQFSGALRPEYVIPFKKNKEAAINALKNHYQGKKLLPKSFVDGNHIEDIQGVYVPFWLFNAEGEGDMFFHASNSETRRQGNEEITTTKHFNVRRKGKVSFEKVPVDASTRMPDGHMDSIEPFDYSELKEFSCTYLPGFLADKYDVEIKDCSGRMEERCKESLEDLLSNSVKGYDAKEVKEKNLVVRKGDVHYALFPVWLLATKWNEQNFLFAMNGQTGKLVGDLPLDKSKYFKYLFGITGGCIALMLVLCNLVLQSPPQGIMIAVAYILLPLLIGFISVSVMKGSLNSVHKQKAAAYVDKKGLELEIELDQYVRTTTQTRVIQTAEQKK